METIEQIPPKEVKKESKYDVVVVLGGNIRKTPRRGFVTTSFIEGPEKSIGAHSRTLAAAELYKKGEAKYFIVSTGKTHPDPTAPSEAAVMKAEMIRYGVPQELIIMEDRSLTTLENAKECAAIIRQKNFKRIGILTSSWHLPRAKVMFGAQGLEQEGRKVSLISLDKILAKRSKRHKMLIKQVYTTESMKTRMAREKKGVADFRAGRYKSLPPH